MAILDRLKNLFGLDAPLPRARRVGGAVGLADSPYGDSMSTDPHPAESYHDLLAYKKARRRDRYDIYDAMDKMADVASVLDAYAEDATQVDREHEATIWIEADDAKTKRELEGMLKRIRAEEWAEGGCRDLGKYGDDFARVIGAPGKGVLGLEWADPRDVERVEDHNGVLRGFETSRTLADYKTRLTSDPNADPSYRPWDFLHWRLYKQKRLPHEKYRNIYGTSLLWGTDRIAKQIKILDDLLMVVRLTRSLDRRIYYVDTGRSPVEEEVRILKRWRRALKRKTFLDPTTGRFDSRFNPFAWSEDEFWPNKEGKNNRVEMLEGISDVKAMVDIDHFRNKFFGSLRAPKAYFGYEGEINAKATLSSQSLKWARAVNSLQKGFKQGLTRLCQIHLAYMDLDTDLSKFRVMMVTPSVIELLDRLEAWQVIIDVATSLAGLGETLGLEQYEWTEYIMRNVLWLSKQEIDLFLSKLKQKAEPPSTEDPSKSADGSPKPPPPEPTEKEPPQKTERLEEIDKAIARLVGGHPMISATSSELPPRSA
jgi:Bacteriophage T4-like portal protein (Gp20)